MTSLSRGATARRCCTTVKQWQRARRAPAARLRGGRSGVAHARVGEEAPVLRGVEQRWKDRELLRHRRVQPSWVGRSRLPSKHWARLPLQHQQTSSCAPPQPTPALFTLSLHFPLRALAFLLLYHLRIDLRALAHALRL